MGCDIHMYVEYKTKFKDVDGKSIWYNFGHNVSPGRNYDFFAILGGVRGSFHSPIAANKGLPKNISYSVQDENYIFVVDEKEVFDGACSREDAERYIKHGSHYLDDKKNRVSHPDWHSHSWATLKEYKKALKLFGVQREEWPELHAVLDLMKSFEKSGRKSRLVFWFDN